MEVKEMAANKYTGTQTEKNLQEAFAGESQRITTYFSNRSYAFIKYNSFKLIEY